MMPAMASSGQGSVSLNAQLLVDSIPALIHTARPDGYLDYFNKPWLEYLGVTLDKVTGWNWTAFIHPEDVEGIVAKWRACLATGEVFEYETRVRCANGEYRWMFPPKVPLRDANGDMGTRYGASLAIEERKPAEEKLRRSERDLHSIIETIPAMVWSAAPDGTVDFFNPRWLDYTSLSPDQSRDWGWTAAIHPDDLSRIKDAWQSILVSGEPGETETRLRRFDGAYRWFLFRANPLRDESGKIVKWYGTNVDIEDRKRAEEELRRSEFYLSEGQRLAHMGSWVLDAAGCFPYWSHELFHIYGLGPAKEGPSFEEYLARIHPQDREFMRSLINRMIAEASGCDVTKRIVRPSGEVRYVRCVGVRTVENGTLKRIVGSAIDVTEHELLTQELRRREAYLTEAQRLSHTGSFGWRPDSGEIVWSDETYRVFEYDRSVKPTIDSVVQRVHPQDRADFQKVIADASRGATDFEHTYRLLLPDGRVKHVHALAHALQDASGNREFVGAVTDITEQRHAEAVIREQEAELREVVDTIPAIVWSTLPDGSNTYVNKRFVEYSGSSAEQMAGSGWQALIHPDDLERHAGKWMEAVATGKPHEIEVRSRRSDGQYRWQLDRGVPLRDKDGNIVKWYGVTTDIEDRKRAEEALQLVSNDLQDSKAKLEEAQQIAHVGYWEWDLTSNRVIWSDETYRIYGLRPQEYPIDIDVVRKMIHSEDLEFVFRVAEEAVRGGLRTDAEHRIVRPSGELRTVHSQGDLKKDASGRPCQMFGTVQDITDRKRAEKELLRSQFYISEGQRLAHMGSWAFNPAGFFEYWSQELFEIYGLDPQKGAPTLEQYLATVHPQDRDFMANTIKRMLAERSGCDVKKRIVRANGELRYIRCVGIPVVEGEVLKGFLGTAIDITEQELLTQESERRQAYLAEAQRLTHTGSWAINVATDELFWSEEIFRIYEIDPVKLKPAWSLILDSVHPDDRASLEQRKKMESTQTEWAESESDFRIVVSDGKIKHLHSIAHPVMDASGQIIEVIGTVMDVTERKRVEDSLRRSERHLAEAQKLTHTGSWG